VPQWPQKRIPRGFSPPHESHVQISMPKNQSRLTPRAGLAAFAARPAASAQGWVRAGVDAEGDRGNEFARRAPEAWAESDRILATLGAVSTPAVPLP
jgi:hypothetical protein